MPEYAYVYILSNSFRKLYIGITSDLPTRITQHKTKTNPDSHTARYGIDKLVYFERFTMVVAAIKREKVLKGWLRRRKLELIITANPLWHDLSEDWGKPVAPFNESDLRPPQTFPENIRHNNTVVLHSVQDDGEKQNQFLSLTRTKKIAFSTALLLTMGFPLLAQLSDTPPTNAPTAACNVPARSDPSTLRIFAGNTPMPFVFACGQNRPQGQCAYERITPGTNDHPVTTIAAFGNTVALNGTNWSCISFSGITGWVPADRLTPLPGKPSVPLSARVGYWRNGPNAGKRGERLLITPANLPGRFASAAGLTGTVATITSTSVTSTPTPHPLADTFTSSKTTALSSSTSPTTLQPTPSPPTITRAAVA